tara:strand:- start:1363 stop:2130 length:768 start_codon:yes stop_codon:yes gene_type:complete
MSIKSPDQYFYGLDTIDPIRIKMNSEVPVYQIFNFSNFEAMDNIRLNTPSWENQLFKVKRENIVHYGDIVKGTHGLDFKLNIEPKLNPSEISLWWSYMKVMKKARKHSKPIIIINQNAKIMDKNIKYKSLEKNAALITDDGDLNDRGLPLDVLAFKWDARQYFPGHKKYNPSIPSHVPYINTEVPFDDIEPSFTTGMIIKPEFAEWVYDTFAVERAIINRSLEGFLRTVYDFRPAGHKYTNLCVKYKCSGQDYFL